MARRRTSRNRTQARPIWSGVWFFLFSALGVLLWVMWRAPLMPFIWLGMLIGGATQQYPVAASGRKNDDPSERQMAVYHRWKDILAGLLPNGDWLEVRRVYWWMGLLLGMLSGLSGAWWVTLLDAVFGFMCGQGVAHWRNRVEDRRHIYKGVSIPAFLRKGKTWMRLTAVLSAVAVFCSVLVFAVAGYMSWFAAPALPGLVFLLLVWLMGRKPQSQYWRDRVDGQRLIDGWVSGDDLQKAWAGAYLTQVNKLGDPENPMIVYRIRLQGSDGKPRSNEGVFKLGVEAVKAPAMADGYRFVSLLAVKQKKRGAEQFDPSSVRLVTGMDESCIPSIAEKSAGEGLASLVADIAYANTACLWHKRAPLMIAHDVSADEKKAAWLLEVIMPPQGGDSLDRVGFDWLAGDGSPEKILRMPVFADLQDKFHLIAFDSTPLSDKGNKWRPDGMTQDKSFNRYIELSRRFKQEQTIWADLLPPKLNPPAPIYDYEESEAGNQCQIHRLPLVINAPATPADYARCDLNPLQPDAKFIGIVDEGGGVASMIWGTGAAPVRIDRLVGTTVMHRLYAQAMIFKTLLDVLPAKASVTINSCTSQSKTKAIWTIQFQLGNGATVEDARKQSARIQSSAGARHIYWEWRSADIATIWLCADPYLDVRDLRYWNRPQKQKQLIELALSDAWGVAGVSDPSGRAPDVISLGALPSNHDVLLARFRIPAGLDVEKPAHNVGKFLTSADYAYGRILPRGEEHGSNLYDMVLAKRSPFPTMVDADWDFARQSEPRLFPLGVDDMGKPVYWNMKDTFHLLISGKSGTGKSSIAQIVVAEALLKGHDIILIDPSKGCIDFTQWAKPLALAFVGLGQMRETEAVIAWLRHEMAERVELFSRYGVGSIYDLDKSRLTPDELNHVQPIDLVFDEFNSYLQEAGKTTQNPNRDIQLANDNAAVSATNNSIRRTMSALGKIVVQGRTAGISVILGAQRLTMDDMKPYNANAFFRSLGRILLGMDSTAGIISAQNLREANRLQQSLKGEGGKIPQGRGIFETAQGELLAVQTWWSGGQEKLAELFADRTPPQPIDYSRFMPSEAETYGEVSEDELSKLLNQETPNPTGEEIEDIDELNDMLHKSDDEDTDGDGNDSDDKTGDDGIEEVNW